LRPARSWGLRKLRGQSGQIVRSCSLRMLAHHPELLSLAERGSGVRAWTTGRGRPEEFRQAKIRAIETWGSKLRLQLRPVGIRIVARPVGKVAIQISSE
jgi:hypothetical protein